MNCESSEALHRVDIAVAGVITGANDAGNSCGDVAVNCECCGTAAEGGRQGDEGRGEENGLACCDTKDDAD